MLYDLGVISVNEACYERWLAVSVVGLLIWSDFSGLGELRNVEKDGDLRTNLAKRSRWANHVDVVHRR